MNYWPACSTNLNECVWPLIDFIRTLVKPGEKQPKPISAHADGQPPYPETFSSLLPLTDENMSWNFNPMAGPWLATHIWEYYDYTRDKKFLKEVGYDLIKSSANFAVDYLWHKPDGDLHCCSFNFSRAWTCRPRSYFCTRCSPRNIAQRH